MGNYLAISGSIACGKTTLYKALAQSLGFHAFCEEAAQNPFLSSFYDSYPIIQKHAFQSQMWFLCYKHVQLQEISKLSKPAVVERCLEENLLFARLLLGAEEYKIYMDYYNLIASSAHQPVFILYLTLPLEEQLHRIQKRGISYEQHIDREYLTKLNSMYEHWGSGCTRIRILRIQNTQLQFEAIQDVVRQEMSRYPQVTLG